MAVVNALLDRVTITGVEMSFNNNGACIIQQNNGCWYLVRQNSVVLNMLLNGVTVVYDIQQNDSDGCIVRQNDVNLECPCLDEVGCC